MKKSNGGDAKSIATNFNAFATSFADVTTHAALGFLSSGYFVQAKFDPIERMHTSVEIYKGDFLSLYE